MNQIFEYLNRDIKSLNETELSIVIESFNNKEKLDEIEEYIFQQIKDENYQPFLNLIYFLYFTPVDDIVSNIIAKIDIENISEVLEITFQTLNKVVNWLDKNKVIIRKNSDKLDLEKLQRKIENTEKELEKHSEYIKQLEKSEFLKQKLYELIKTESTILNEECLKEMKDIKNKEENSIRIQKSEIKKLNDNIEILNQEKRYIEEKLNKEKILNKELSQKIGKLQKEIKNIHTLELEKNKIAEKLKFSLNTIEEIKETNKELKETLSQKEEKIENLQNEIMNEKYEKVSLEKTNGILKEKLDEYENKLDSFKGFDEVIRQLQNPKLTNLLMAILKTESLSQMRLKFDLKDDNLNSLLKLFQLTLDSDYFVNIYYPFIEEYKKRNIKEIKENENIMSLEEINFYNKVNEYFNDIIVDIDEKEIKILKFDPLKHEDINGLEKGKLVKNTPLIPLHKKPFKKAKVLLKKSFLGF